MSRWTRGLNPEQGLAIQHNFGPMLILAGAGSGKTTVLVARTGRMIDDGIARPENLLVLTFTNKAAREVRNRVAAKLGELPKSLWTGTFHSFGLKLLRQYHREAGLPAYFGVLDQTDCQSILRELMKDIKIAGKDKFEIETLLELINQRRVLGRAKQEGFDEYHEMAEMLYPKFLKKLELLGGVDFEGLLLKPIQLFQDFPGILHSVQEQYQHVMVDEFQDTNVTQMKLIDQIVTKHRNICVVGDDDQSIYGWRGAEVRNILDFPKKYPPCEVIRLERNYRSTPAILDLANGVIVKNKHRHGKILKSESGEEHGEIPELFVLENEDDEADLALREIRDILSRDFRHADVAILYRSNSQGAMLESVFRQNQVPYTVSGSTAFFDRKEIKDILAYLRFALQPNDVSLRRIINTPTRGIGDTTIEKLGQYAQTQNKSFVQACAEWQQAGVGEKAGQVITTLLGFCQSLPGKIMSGQQAGANLLQILREMGYRDHLYRSSSSSESGEKRWTLVEIFSRVLDSFVVKGGMSVQTLREFLDAMELRDKSDDDDKEKNSVSLMTLHASKGLEFPFVFLLGVEEDLLPHKTLGGNVDEERRLFYVGLTRAKKQLILTRCKLRRKYGDLRRVSPSRFLLEVAPGSLRTYENGVRPVSGEQRDKLFSSFMNKLESKKR